MKLSAILGPFVRPLRAGCPYANAHFPEESSLGRTQSSFKYCVLRRRFRTPHPSRAIRSRSASMGRAYNKRKILIRRHPGAAVHGFYFFQSPTNFSRNSGYQSTSPKDYFLARLFVFQLHEKADRRGGTGATLQIFDTLCRYRFHHLKFANSERRWPI
jgi:hypothetical protein